MEKIDVIKWSWAGHLLRMKNDRWVKKCTEWTPRTKRSRGRPARRWGVMYCEGSKCKLDYRKNEQFDMDIGEAISQSAVE